VRSSSFINGSDRVKLVCGTLCLDGFINFECIMSWQDYVDKQLLASRCVTKAAIAGHDGNVWAKSDGFEVSISESSVTNMFEVLSEDCGLIDKIPAAQKY